MSDVVSHDGPLEAPSKKDLPEAFGGRRCAESELLLISEAVARLEDGMYGNFGRPEAVMAAKKAYPGFTIGFGPRKEDAVTLIDDALKKGELSVFVLPESNERGTPLKVPSEVLGKMIRIRGGLPDRVVQPIRIFAGDPIAPELLAALSKSALYLRRKEFEPWYKTGRKKRNWPSHAKQRNSRRFKALREKQRGSRLRLQTGADVHRRPSPSSHAAGRLGLRGLLASARK